jgi:quinol monooxygenase YgiN
MATPLILVTTRLPPIARTELISTCRALIQKTTGDWLFLTCPTEFLSLQFSSRSNLGLSGTKPLVHDILAPLVPSLTVTALMPSMGFSQLPNQDIPVAAHTTVARYRVSAGNRAKVISDLRDLFEFAASEEEDDVYGLTIMNNEEDVDKFIILERFVDEEAEKRHLGSEEYEACHNAINGMIVSHDRQSYQTLDV